MLSQFTFPLGVKTHRKFLPNLVIDLASDLASAQATQEDDVVDFAHLYLVLEPMTYAHVFSWLDKHDRAVVRETCQFWKGIVDERREVKTGR